VDKINLILIGAGGHCLSCIDVISATNKFKIKGLVDLPSNLGNKVSKYSIEYTDKDIQKLANRDNYFLLTIGQIESPNIRIDFAEKIKSIGGKFATVISPLAYVSNDATVGEGSIVMHHALINAGADVGKQCIINSKSLIEHDATIGNYCHLSTGSIVNGSAIIEDKCFLGSNSVAVDRVRMKQGTFLKSNERFA
jgi:sugar O-acyltransferase (sialic acid O-acetyltransferase NeuD family)